LATIERLLADPASTLVCVVTTPEELAVRETIELMGDLRARLGLTVAPPIANAVPERRFTKADVAALARLEGNPHPYLAAARFHLQRHEQAEIQLTALTRALGVRPLRLP